MDSVLYANEMNQHWHLSDQMQYDFFRYGLPKNLRRYGKWEKRSKDDEDAIALVQEVYGYSRVKAVEALPLLASHMDVLEAHVNKGGKKKSG